MGVPSQWEKTIYELFMQKTGGDYNRDTDSLEALGEAIASLGMYGGVITAVSPDYWSDPWFTIASLAGLGETKFKNWTAYFFWKSTGAGDIPQGESKVISTYTNAGTFTTDFFSDTPLVGDEILIVNPLLANILPSILTVLNDPTFGLAALQALLANIQSKTSLLPGDPASESEVEAAIAAAAIASTAGLLKTHDEVPVDSSAILGAETPVLYLGPTVEIDGTVEHIESLCRCLTSDGTYIYAGLYTSPAQVVQIDPTTMTVVAIWTGGAYCQALAWDGTYIYAGLASGQVVKIDPTTMTTVLTWTGIIDVLSLLSDGTYIYAGLGITGGVVQIDPTTMTTVAIWTDVNPATDQSRCDALAYDGTYVYVGVTYRALWPYAEGVIVVKLDPTTMTRVGMWEEYAFELSHCTSLAFDGTYIYAGIIPQDVAFGQVVKIDPTTMTRVGTWAGGAGENACQALAFDGAYIYAGLSISPSKVVQIDPATMLTVLAWTGAAGQNECYALAYDGSTYIYAGLLISPAQVVQIDPTTMLTVLTWTGVSVPFIIGETVSGSDSGATGIVIAQTTNSITVAVLSGAFDYADTITGDSSGATLTDITAISTPVVLHLMVDDLVLNFEDPDPDTIDVRLYKLDNGTLQCIKTVSVATPGGYYTLADLFGQDHLAGDQIKITVEVHVGGSGPYDVTGSYAYRSA
jgi:hypothetical protein